MLNITSRIICSLGLAFLVTNAQASEYSVTVDGPLTGSSIARNKVSLGIKVNINSTWDELAEDEKTVWREFTELTDAKVTPPFPQPNIRSLLTKLKTPEKFRGTDKITREEGLFLIVHVSEEGVVTHVDIMSGTEKGAPALTNQEKVMAYVYVNALMATPFSPAKMDGKAAASAFPMRIRQLTSMK